MGARYFALIHLMVFSISLISAGVVFFNKKVIMTVKITELNIATIGWMMLVVAVPAKKLYPRMIPENVATVLLSTTLLTCLPDQISGGIAEARYAIKIEAAAPKIPYTGTNTMKRIRNAAT